MPKKEEYGFAYCESVYANGETPWHIRRLTKKGKRLGGGADTKALCGRFVAWDLTKPFDPEEVSNRPDPRCCVRCLESFQKAERARKAYAARVAGRMEKNRRVVKSIGPQVPKPKSPIPQRQVKRVVIYKKE